VYKADIQDNKGKALQGARLRLERPAASHTALNILGRHLHFACISRPASNCGFSKIPQPLNERRREKYANYQGKRLAPSARGPKEWFTGSARIDPLFGATEPSRASGALVTFEPGARTAWRSHPPGQNLIVVPGLG